MIILGILTLVNAENLLISAFLHTFALQFENSAKLSVDLTNRGGEFTGTHGNQPPVDRGLRLLLSKKAIVINLFDFKLKVLRF